MKKIISILTILFFINLNANTQRELILSAYKEYKAENYAVAMKLYKIGCSKGYDTACASIGAMYLEGIGAEKDMVKAKKYLGISCKAGNNYACEMIGNKLKPVKKVLNKQKSPNKSVEVREVYQLIEAKNTKQEYLDIELTVDDSKINRWQKAGFSIEDAKFYIERDISFKRALQWKKSYFYPKDAYYYIKNNITLREAAARINK